jgi:hypothetical protein
MVVSAARKQDAVVTAVRDNRGRQTATGTLRLDPPAGGAREQRSGLPHVC